MQVLFGQQKEQTTDGAGGKVVRPQSLDLPPQETDGLHPHRLRLEFSDARLGLPAVDGLGHKEAGDQEEKFYADVPVPEKGELELLAGEQDELAVPEGAGDVKEDDIRCKEKAHQLNGRVALLHDRFGSLPSILQEWRKKRFKRNIIWYFTMSIAGTQGGERKNADV